MYSVKVLHDLVYSKNIGTDGLLDFYLPNRDDTFPLLIFFHGGGIEGGDKRCDEHIFNSLAMNGIAVVSANYRMYPQAKYPEFINDAAEAVAWVKNNSRNIGNFDRIFIGGSSAGAYLCMMLCFDERYLGKYDIHSEDFAGYFFDSGQPTVHFNILKERGLDPRLVRIDEAAPLYFINKQIIEDENKLKFLILVADNDMQNRLEQNLLLKTTMVAFGYNEYQIEFKLMNGFMHTEYVWAKDKDDNYIYTDIIKRFIKKGV